jgi:hypothetical protein
MGDRAGSHSSSVIREITKNEKKNQTKRKSTKKIKIKLIFFQKFDFFF